MTAASSRIGARVCAVLGAIALFVGAMYAWASPTLFDSDKFAARARHSLEESAALRRVISQCGLEVDRDRVGDVFAVAEALNAGE